MNNNLPKIKIKYFAILVFIMISANSVTAQNGSSVANQEIKEVFNSIVNAYGNAKSPPELRIITIGKLQKSPAIYYADVSPVIKVDHNLYNICAKFGNDKRNALSVILSHELAHYYNDDTFCSDFAFAIKEENNELSDKLKFISKGEKIKLETEADLKGLFYAAMAGYKPFNIYPQLMDSIYKYYQLPKQIDGYPSLEERKAINRKAEHTISKLYKRFQDGISALENGDYNQAIQQFEELNKYFPSRENYNNVGVARLWDVLKKRPVTREESKNPERFNYPVVLDRNSRLEQPKPFSNRTRGNTSADTLTIQLKKAQKDFEKAISLDPEYFPAYINLACVYDLLGNPMAAIGKINELPKKEQNTKDAQRILAIAYYNADIKEKAEEIWKRLNLISDEQY